LLLVLLVGAGVRVRLLAGLGLAGLAAAPIAWFALKEYQRERIMVFLDPFRWYSLRDRKSTRLNSSHVSISYAVFCLKKKKIQYESSCADVDAKNQLCRDLGPFFFV